MKTLRVLTVFFVLVLGLSACSKGKPPAAPLKPEIGFTRDESGWVVRVKFDHPVMKLNREEQDAGTDTILVVSPEVPGKTTWVSPDELQFVPEDKTPLTLATSFELVQVEGDKGKGAVRSPKPGAWKLTVNPSQLALTSSVLTPDYPAGEATVTLHFNLAYDLESLKKAVSLSVDSVETPVEVSRFSDFAAKAKFKLPKVEKTTRVKLALAAGVSASEAKVSLADMTVRDFTLEPPGLVLNGIDYSSGGNGYYLTVSCTDEAMPPGDSYICEIPEDELAKVKVSPMKPGKEPTLVATQNGFRVLGEFSRGDYVVTVPAGLRTRSGGVLAETGKLKVTLPARPPRVRFTSRGRYLPRGRLNSIPVSYLNVKEFTVTVRQVPEQNLVFWFSGRNENADDRTSEQLATRKLLVKAEEDREALVWLDLKGMVPADGRGLYEIGLSSDEISSDYSRLILTDLALVAKRTGPDGQDLMVWTMHAETLVPAAGARIEVRTKSNTLIASATADENGLAVIPAVAAKDAPAPYAVLARTDSDFTGLKFSDLELQLAEFPVSGDPFRLAQAYRSAVWTDRGAYRPGDPAHFVAVLWEDAGRAPEKPVPVVGKMLDPRGKECGRFTGKTNPAGLVTFDHQFPDFALTGHYEFVLEVGGAEAGREGFWVEEFMPERVKVKVAPKEPEAGPGAPAAFDLSASYLFGAVARGEPFEAECSIEPAEFRPKKLSDYYFGVYRPDGLRPIPLGKVAGKLSDEGKAEFTCPPLANYMEMMGPSRVRAQVAVMEAGSGRTSSSDGAMLVHPDERYVGLKSSTREAGSNQRVTVAGVVVGLDGQPVAGTLAVVVEAALVQQEESWRFNPAVGRSEWQTYTRRLRAKSQEVTAVNGRFTFGFDTGDWGEGYLVSARLGKKALTELYIPMSGGDYYWCDECEGGGGGNTPKPATPEALVITAPEAVEAGQDNEAVIDAPFPGRLLFSVETDEVLDHRWVDVMKAGPVRLPFQVEKFRPNVYLSALLIKDPRAESKDAFMPGRAFGVVPVRLKPVQDELSVKLNVPAEMRPNHDLTVAIEAGPAEGALFATVAAVDEGVLQLTRFQSPDPLSEIYARRGLGVNTFETIGWSLILPAADQAIGGDAGDEVGGQSSRPQPVKPVALWSGIVELDKNGKGKATFRVPSYQGELRVMAVAAGPERIGATSAAVKVRDPLSLAASFPRFMVMGDNMVAPVFVQNLTGSPQTVTVKVSSTPELSFTGSTEETLTLRPDEAGVAVFTGKATTAGGAAQVKITAKSATEESSAEATVPMQPDAPVVRERQYVELKPGANELSSYLRGFTPEYQQTVITVSGRRFMQQMSHLAWLVQYPYGCIEQTTSFTRPLLFIGNLLPSIDPKLLADGSVEKKFMFGANRLLSMQTSEGGFSYWPGMQENTYWGTAYATHLLLEGIDAGYPISKERVDEALAFMERTLTDNPDRIDPKYGYSVPQSEPYMQFVLARAGRGRAKRVQELIKNPNPTWKEMTTENLYLLKAALYLMGDRTYEGELKSPGTTIAGARTNDWSFWSGLRSAGLILNVGEDLFPGSPGLEALTLVVADRLKDPNSDGFTTQELSWCVSGLGKRAGGLGTEWAPPSLTVDGRAIKPNPATPEPADPKQKKPGSPDVTFAFTGGANAKSVVLNVEWLKGGKVYVLVQSEGLKPGQVYLASDNTLNVRRAYRKLNGDPVDLKQVALGEVVFVELTVKNPTQGKINNVAVVDRFGSGLEIENPRLNREHLAAWVDAGKVWEMDYMNIRDDRIELFGALPPGEVKFVYALRATVPGTFATPPVRAEAMYDPTVWSQALGQAVTIAAPWKQ